jgi:hypothetical protein
MGNNAYISKSYLTFDGKQTTDNDFNAILQEDEQINW